MAEGSAQEKTEVATPRKRRDAKKKGQVARSQELSSFMVLFTALLCLMALGPTLGRGITGLMAHVFGTACTTIIDSSTFPQLGRFWVEEAVRMVSPLWLALLLVGMGSAVAQVGLSVNPSLLNPKPERINPLSGFKRIFSKKSAFEFFKSVLKMGLVLIIAWTTLKGAQRDIIGISDLELMAGISVVAGVMGKLAGRLIILMVILAIADFAFQKWQHEQEIKMTKEELKQEYKETEGDPVLKSRLRALQREMAMQRMMADVKTADVVVTNPTHYAVALKYEEEMNAPKVVARGKDRVAQRIKEIAREAKVPVVENRPLARALYADCKVGKTIPIKFFQAVAELLAMVFQGRHQSRAGGV